MKFHLLIIIHLLVYAKAFCLLPGKNMPNKTTKVWTQKNVFRTNVFIKNQGQFIAYQKSNNRAIEYAILNDEKYFFHTDGITFIADNRDKLSEEIIEANKRKKTGADLIFAPAAFTLKFINSNKNTLIEPKIKSSSYYTFGEKGFENTRAEGFETINYENLYNNIDFSFSVPDEGGVLCKIKALPSADLSQIKMQYSGDISEIKTDENGTLKIVTKNGDMSVYSPIAYYEDKTEVKVKFAITQNTISFIFPDGYNSLKTLSLETWSIFPGTINSNNCVYDIDLDIRGNVYISGGTHPFKLSKYSSEGTLLWTYTNPSWFNANYAYSRFCVLPHSGSVFIGEDNGLGPRILKINPDGTHEATSQNLEGNTEIWVMFFNKCTGQLIGFGGGTNSSNNFQIIADTSLSTSTAQNFNNYTNSYSNDVAAVEMDYNGDFYALMASSSNYSSNHLQKCLSSNNYSPQLGFDVNTGFNFDELGSDVRGLNMLTGYSNRANAIAKNNNYIFVYDGRTIKAWDKITGSFVNSVVVDNLYNFGNQRTHEGIAADNCNRIYVGGNRAIHIYSFTNNEFQNIGTITTNISGEVFDVRLNHIKNIIYVCGDGFLTAAQVQNCNSGSLNMNVNNTSELCSNSANIEILGGTPPYYYSWSNGSDSPSISDIEHGIYNVTVFDNSCNTLIGKDSVVFTRSGNSGISRDTSVCKGSSVLLSASFNQGYTYQWAPAEFLNSTNGPSVIATPMVNTDFYVTITSSECSVIDTISIGVKDIPNIDISPSDTFICSNTTRILNAGNGFDSYLWGNTETSQTIEINTGGLYFVTVRNADGCKNADTINITEIETHTSITGDLEICSNEFGTISAEQGFSSYLWNNGVQNYLVPITHSGLYQVTVTDQFGCKFDTSVYATVFTAPDPEIYSSKNEKICTGDTIKLYTDNYLNYLWNTGENTKEIYVSNSGYYSLIVHDANNCTGSKSTEINFQQPSTPDISIIKSDNDTICENTQLTLTTVIPETGINGIYKWFINGTLTGDSGNTYSSTSFVNGDSIKCTFEPSGNCYNKTEASTTVKVFPEIVASASSNQTEGCQPLQVSLNGSTYMDNMEYSWYCDDKLIGTGPFMTHEFKTSGEYEIVFSVLNKKTNCTKKIELSNKIKVFQKPVADFTFQENLTLSNPEAEFINTSSDASNYFWDFGDGHYSYDFFPKHRYETFGIYIVKLDAENEHSCKDSKQSKLSVETGTTFYLPNVFRPLDGGYNNLFYVSGHGISNDGFDMKIYNRWGFLVFSTTNYDPNNPEQSAWDGKHNGEIVQDGAYTWICRFKDNYGKSYEKKGTIIVLK